MDGPSVKGIAFRQAAYEIGHLIETGQLHPRELEHVLKSEDLPYLHGPLPPVRWYPVGAYGRCAELLLQVEGGRRENLVWRGAALAEELLREGGGARLVETARDGGGNALAHILLNLGARLYSFMRWDLVGDFDEPAYTVEVRGAEPFPDVLRPPTEGFLARLHSLASGRSLSASSERPAPDRMLFRLAAGR